MDLSGLWNQFLLNTTICVRPDVSLVQGIQIITPYVTSNDTNSSLSSDSNPPNQENEDEADQDNDEKIEQHPIIDDDDDENDEEAEAQKKRSIQRVRYSKEEYRCKQCPYTCTTEKAFLRHLRWCDSSDDVRASTHPLSCPICGKDRKDEETLSVHMTKHKQEKHFCCDICKFRSLQLKKLIQHRRMHTGEKPHLCPFCSYRSSRRDNLRSHVRRVHKKNDLPCDTFTPRSMVLSPRKLN